ncbi:MAG: SPOR domain-containing protein [Acidovorax sp.]|jgi:cell division protein FtsN|nr:SPOR domain-containing protein [Acidovorax sp.]
MSAPTPLSADNPLMPRLYQAAIGPLQTAYYQQQFERFDALGRPLPSWNWAAGCCTLGWMGLRGLWKPAIAYAAILAALMALWWALDLHHRLPMPAAWALALLLVLLCVLLPGLGGNALYHRHVRQRTMQALTQSRTLGEAMTLLQAQAPTPARLQWATTGHALAALLTAGLAWAASTSLPAAPAAASAPADANAPHTQQDMARALAALQPAMTAEATVADGTPTEPSTSAPAAESETPHAEAAVSPPVAEASATAAAPALVAASAALAAAPTASGNGREEASATPAPAATPERKPADKTAKAEKTKNAQPAKVDKTEKTEKAAKVAKAGKSDAKTEAAQKTALQSGKFYLNSGLYAQPENARRVARQLGEAGQPVFTQLVASRKGEATRVRVGPFDNKVQAEAAAQKIQALQLEAQLFRHAAD